MPREGSIRRTRALVALFVVALAVLLPANGSHADTKTELKTAETKLDRLLARIKDESATYAQLEGQATKLSQTMGDIQDRLAQATASMVAIQQQLRSVQDNLQAARDQLDLRARIVYENGPGGNLEFLLGSTSLSDLSDRMEIINNVARSDHTLIDAINVQQGDLQTQQTQVQKVQNGLAQARHDYAVQQAQLQGKLVSAKQVLTQLRRDRAAASLEVGLLRTQRAAEVKAELAAALAAMNAGSGDAPSISGAFDVCPVAEPHAYVDSFGAPRYAGGYHPHAGNDIMAPRGTEIRAPFDGVARDASNGLGGMSVKVYGAQGWVYNAHLSGMGRLGTVKAGTVIGYVGDSGDARGGATHDHFEWHPYVLPANLWVSPYGYKTINSAIDPYPYLNAVC